LFYIESNSFVNYILFGEQPYKHLNFIKKIGSENL